jgi:TolB protein
MIAEQNAARRRRTRGGVADVEDLGRLLGARQSQPFLSRFPGRLSLLDPRTGELSRVHAAPIGSVPLAWSDDHERLLFLSNHREKIQLYEYDRESGEVRTVTSGQNQHLWGDFGPGGQLAILEVVHAPGGSFSRIFVTDSKGRNPRVVLDREPVENMRLSPDGSVLVYVRHPFPSSAARSTAPELVALDLNDGTDRVLGRGRDPTFSPVGGWIVYSAPTRDGWRLRRMRPDGSARAPLGTAVRDEKTPSTSPDGRFVVFVGESMGLDRLFVKRIDGSGNRILLDVGSAFAPVW